MIWRMTSVSGTAYDLYQDEYGSVVRLRLHRLQSCWAACYMYMIINIGWKSLYDT